MDEIQNRVASSALMVFDLEDYYPEGIKTQIDLAVWLIEGFLLKEKEFRQALAQHDWSQYQNQYVAIHCSTDAILPAWAEQLVAVQLMPYAKKVVLGSAHKIDELLYAEILATVDYSPFEGKPIINYGERNNFRLPAYHRLDLSATWTGRQDKKFKSSWNFSIYNVYSRLNPFFIYIDPEGDLASGNFKNTAKMVSLFQIIPSVTYNMSF